MIEKVTVNFIIGVEGSGTTMMSRLLSFPKDCEVILGNHISVSKNNDSLFQRLTGFKPKSELNDILIQLEQSTAALWSRKSGVEVAKRGGDRLLKAISDFASLQEMSHAKKLFLKRSAPFYTGDEYRPDIFDIVDMFPNGKILVMLRDPKASSYSALRRKFVDNIRYSAIVCEEQLMLMDFRLKMINPDSFLVMNYESFCNDPESNIGKIASLFALNNNEMLESVALEKVLKGKNNAWRQKLSEPEVDFLDNYFDARRLSQFSILKFDYQDA